MSSSDHSKVRNVGHSLAQASIAMKQCKFHDAELHAKDAWHSMKKIEDSGEFPLATGIRVSIGTLVSMIMSTKGSMNAADNAARISGMCDSLAMALEQ